jgi:hypothetical protein
MLDRTGWTGWTGYQKTPGQVLLATYEFFHAAAHVFSELLLRRFFSTLTGLTGLTTPTFMRLFRTPLTLTTSSLTLTTLTISIETTTFIGKEFM